MESETKRPPSRYKIAEGLIFDAIRNLNEAKHIILPAGYRSWGVIRGNFDVKAIFESTGNQHSFKLTKKPIDLSLPNTKRQIEKLMINTWLAQNNMDYAIGGVLRRFDLSYQRMKLNGSYLDGIYINTFRAVRIGDSILKIREVIDSIAPTPNPLVAQDIP